jgi:hypothetical protein
LFFTLRFLNKKVFFVFFVGGCPFWLFYGVVGEVVGLFYGVVGEVVGLFYGVVSISCELLIMELLCELRILPDQRTLNIQLTLFNYREQLILPDQRTLSISRELRILPGQRILNIQSALSISRELLIHPDLLLQQ